MLRDWKTSSYWFTIKKTNQNNPAVVHGIGILKDSILGVWWLPCCPAWKHHHFCFLSAGRKPQFFKLKNKKGQKRKKWRKKKKKQPFSFHCLWTLHFAFLTITFFYFQTCAQLLCKHHWTLCFSSMKMREMNKRLQGRLLGRCCSDIPKKIWQYSSKIVIFSKSV